jgi:Asp-tRNA(Asn)/Glu-tRNA(Gln) amidotransferase A subunit family amidase
MSTAVERTRAALAAIEAWEPEVNAFTEVFGDEALARAAEAQAEGALAGVPVAVKDTIWMAGKHATRGSRAFRDFVPDQHAVAVSRLLAAGAVAVGKTTNPELCFRGVTESALSGVTRNPFDRSRATGGSSGGSGAAVSYGAVPVALGTDGGGSIRIPASFCGVVGHKPTFGLVPVTPGFRGWETLSVVGPLGRTVDDVRTALGVIAGHHPSDPGSLPHGAEALHRPAPAPDTLRIAASVDLGHVPVEPDVRAAFAAALDTLRDAGWQIEDACPEPMASAPLWTAIAVAEGYAADRSLLTEHLDELEEDTARLLAAGEHITAVEYLDALDERARFTRAWEAFFASYDVLLTPMMQMTALPIGMLSPPEIDGQPVDPFFDDWCAFCLPANLTGGPATTLPCGYDSAGLPIGLQVTAARMNDHVTLAVAAAWEALFASRRRDPVLKR